MFFDSSDHFFTDYHWTLDTLNQSVINAGTPENIKRVFTGIDIFGRGTYAGG